MNAIKKYVASRTLTSDDLTWNNTTLLSADDALGDIAALRDQGGGDLLLMGSASLAKALLAKGLVDELNLMIEPILLGGGKTIFPEDGQARPMQLVKSVTAGTGVQVCTPTSLRRSLRRWPGATVCGSRCSVRSGSSMPMTATSHPTGALQRRLLALLVLRRGRVVSVDTAVEVLWPSGLPADPVAALQNHLFRLRRGLSDGVIDAVGDGYRLDAARVDLDAERFSAILDGGATADEAALAELDAVLARWSGPAYPELDDIDDGRAEAARLDELRIRAREVRADARLALGDTDGLVAELVAWPTTNPCASGLACC